MLPIRGRVLLVSRAFENQSKYPGTSESDQIFQVMETVSVLHRSVHLRCLSGLTLDAYSSKPHLVLQSVRFVAL